MVLGSVTPVYICSIVISGKTFMYMTHFFHQKTVWLGHCLVTVVFLLTNGIHEPSTYLHLNSPSRHLSLRLYLNQIFLGGNKKKSKN